MKTKSKIIRTITVIVFMATGNSLLAQQIDWHRGGNGFGGTPIFGTNVAQTITIRTGGLAAGNTRMFIMDGGTGAADGFIGLGNGFTGPTSRLHLHQGTNAPINQHFVELEGLDKPFLSQNRPNPFSGQTEIDYYIPAESATDAHILFYDQLGRMLKDEPLKAGFGTVTVNTHNLPAGVYTYKLLINGQVLDTKKMVYQK